jgi:flavin reductase (DIM6/NTAB) family NADH-FMN oxidoreductase RutF
LEGIAMSFTKISPEELEGNVFDLIGEKWMLITAGNEEKLNTMTASWGNMGVLWGKPVTTCFIRPTRYTLEFMEREDYYTLSFYGEKYRKQLSICGSDSGRDVDKVKKTGFKPVFADCGAPYFKEAELVLVCRKLYVDDIKPENFTDKKLDNWYPDKDYHRVFIGEIVEVLRKD